MRCVDLSSLRPGRYSFWAGYVLGEVYRTGDERERTRAIGELDEGMRIPNTDSIQELAEFWDTHSVTDIADELKEKLHSG